MKISSKNPVHINYSDGDRNVVVTPDDEDRFIVSAREAAEACCIYGDQLHFFENLKSLSKKLCRWLNEHDEKITKAFLGVREGALFFVVIRKSCRFDPVFSENLTKLDMDVARDKELMHLPHFDVLGLPHVPDESAMSFLEPRGVMVFGRAEQG